MTYLDVTGAYTADRAAALAGVPKSTLHYWARTEILVPSVSPEKVKLWSFSDLLCLRFIGWLREPKIADDGQTVPASAMPKIRRALEELRGLELSIFDRRGDARILADKSGHVFIRTPDGVIVDGVRSGQLVFESIDLLAPFRSYGDLRGPDLIRPRPTLRIVPGKLSGAPHIAHTRIETEALATLRARGFDLSMIGGLYPDAPAAGISDAIDLEEQLGRNGTLAA